MYGKADESLMVVTKVRINMDELIISLPADNYTEDQIRCDIARKESEYRLPDGVVLPVGILFSIAGEHRIVDTDFR